MSISQIPVIFLRLEGPLQSWGLQSRHRVRETGLQPTKSGLIGLVACCMGRRRGEPLDDLAALTMGVRVDRPGILLRDYHTVGAKAGVMSADGKIKKTPKTGQLETLVTDRFYLCDASFLAVLAGDGNVLNEVERALRRPVWIPFLGRKSCPPSVPVFIERDEAPSLHDALLSRAWHPRVAGEAPPQDLRCLIECTPTDEGARLEFDCPGSFAEPRPMRGRYVREVFLTGFPVREPVQESYRPPFIRRVDYRVKAWKERRLQRGQRDGFLCVFCGVPSAVTHHITYRRARNEDVEADLRSVCRRCHDAITMLESQRGFGLDRIDPLDQEWRELILRKRREIDAQRLLRRDPQRG